ncbi:MAG: MBL fold metallo-hydrolase [Candidatus Paceibacterota bacterium]
MPDELFNWLKANKKKAIIIGCALVIFEGIFLVTLFSESKTSRALELHFFDVGQGDSEFVVLPGGARMLIDGGPANGRVMNELARTMSQGERYIDLVLMTHPQLDHFGGLIDVAKQYTIGAFLWSGRGSNAPAFQELLNELRNNHTQMISLGAGDSIRSNESNITILSPTPAFLHDTDLNNSTVVAEVMAANTSALFVGDIGTEVEEYLTHTFNMRADILKVPHHGSRFSSSESFLREVHPKVAIIEVGKNSYGHPTPEVLSRLSSVGARILRTDLNGAAEIVSEGVRNGIRLIVEK